MPYPEVGETAMNEDDRISSPLFNVLKIDAVSFDDGHRCYLTRPYGDSKARLFKD